MFFNEESNKYEENHNRIENYGVFTPNDFDYNMSFYEVIYEKIYSR
jgi:hypothetical protein